MNEKKKGFNLFPEYVWMIFVGMLLALLILTNVIPGHAEEVTPIPTPSLDSNAYNYCTIIYCNVNDILIKAPDQSYIELPSPYSYQVNGDTDAVDRMRISYINSLSTLFSFIPENEFTCFLATNGAPASNINFLRSVFSHFSCNFDSDPDDNPWSEDIFDTSIYTLRSYPVGQYNIGVFVKNSLVAPTATPTPTPLAEHYGFVFQEGSYYRCIQFDAQNLNVNVEASLTGLVSRVLSDYNSNDRIWSRSNLLFANTPESLNPYQYGFAVSLNFTCDSISNVLFYNLGSSLVSSDLQYISENYSGVSIGTLTTSTSASTVVLPNRKAALYKGISQSSSFCSIVYICSSKTNYYVSYVSSNISDLVVSSFTSDFTWQSWLYYLPLYESYSDSSYFNYKAFSLGLRLATDTEVNIPTPTFGPSSTPAPLPTSSESIHVILPSGTPTPTPPFSVPGGSDGSSGSDSPGSIGSGLTSQQTSGILDYWSSFVSDNPAMIFLTSTFQALPQELLYPLYILLFILLLLAVIRLFVHFSGG